MRSATRRPRSSMGGEISGVVTRAAYFANVCVEQIAEQAPPRAVHAHIGLVKHPGIVLALEQVLREHVALVVEDLGVAEIAPPERPVEVVVLRHPLVGGRHVVEEVGRPPRDHQDLRLQRVVDAGVGRRVVVPGDRRIGDQEADAGVERRAHHVGGGEAAVTGVHQVHRRKRPQPELAGDVDVVVELGEREAVALPVEIRVVAGVADPVEAAGDLLRSDRQRVAGARARRR